MQNSFSVLETNPIFLLSDLVLLAFLVPLAWSDCRRYRLPDVLTLPLILIGLTLSLAGFGPAPVDAAIGATVGFAVFWALGALYFQVRQVDGLGLGDAKLAAAAGAWLGWQMLPGFVLMASLSGLAFALATGRDAQKKFAFGVWLCASFAVLRVISRV